LSEGDFQDDEADTPEPPTSTGTQVVGGPLLTPITVFPEQTANALGRWLCDNGMPINWIVDRAQWMAWDTKGDVWDIIAGREVLYDAIRRRLLDLKAAANKIKNEKYERGLLRWDSPRQFDEILRAIAGFPEFQSHQSDWDADPMWVRTSNGYIVILPDQTIYNAQTPAGKASLNSKISTIPARQDPTHLGCCRVNAPWDPAATCPVFDKYLLDFCNGNVAQRDFVLRFFGSCLTADRKDDHSFILMGEGGSGKTKLLNVINNVFGTYAHALSRTLLDSEFQNREEYELAQLAGKRLVTISETGSAPIKEGLFKMLTGDRILTGRHPAGRPFTFNSNIRLVIATNDLLSLGGNAEAIKRRLFIVRSAKSYTADGTADNTLEGKMMTEAPGIFKRLVEGWYDCLKCGGLAPPQSVTDDTDGLVLDFMGSEFERFIHTLVRDPTLTTAANVLYGEYCRWAGNAGIPQKYRLSENKFGRMAGGKFRRVRSSMGNLYMGVGLPPP
jgi:P4 family phage/plasmid primase-like protien